MLTEQKSALRGGIQTLLLFDFIILPFFTIWIFNLVIQFNFYHVFARHQKVTAQTTET
jgi:hypothetical protein